MAVIDRADVPTPPEPSSGIPPHSSTVDAVEVAVPSTKVEKVEYRLRSLRLPLVIYREVAAHLRQIDGVETGLLPQTSKEFDYLQSQVGGLWIRYAATAAEIYQPQIEAVLAYYGDRYGQWETLSAKV